MVILRMAWDAIVPCRHDERLRPESTPTFLAAGRPAGGSQVPARFTGRRGRSKRETIVRYEMMLPYQIRGAIGENWPVVLPLGVLEYHGEHMAVGMDTIAVIEALNDLELE